MTLTTTPTIHDSATALVCAMLSLKASYRAEALHRAGWGAAKTVERSRGFTRWSGYTKRATPATVTISDLYTCPVTRDYLQERGVIKVSKNGAMRLASKPKARVWVEEMMAKHDMWNRFSTSFTLGANDAPAFDPTLRPYGLHRPESVELPS